VVGKLLILNVGYFVRYCLVLHEMLPAGHQNEKSAEKERELLCCILQESNVL